MADNIETFNFNDVSNQPSVEAQPTSDANILEQSNAVENFNFDDTGDASTEPLTVYNNGVPETVNQYDGDTVYTSTGEGIRFPSINTGEVTRVSDAGTIKAGSPLGELQTQVINKVIREQGFDQLVDTGEEGVYGRSIKTLARKDGKTIHQYLVEERILNPTKYTTEDDIKARSANEFQDMMLKYSKDVDPAAQARDIVTYATALTPYRELQLGTTNEEVGGYNAFRSQGNITRLETNIASLEAQLAAEPDGVKRTELATKINEQRETLTLALNASPIYQTSLEYLEDGDGNPKESSSVFGELADSGHLGLLMLENTAANVSRWAGDVLNSDDIEAWSKDWVQETDEDMSKIKVTGFHDVSLSDLSSIPSFFANVVTQYSPQIALIYGSSKVGGFAGSFLGPAGAAAGAIIAGTTTAFMLALGSVYGEQPEGEKDPLLAAGIAIPVAVLDKLGVPGAKAISKGKNFLNKEGRDFMIDAIKRNTPGMTTKQATAAMNRTVAELTQEVGIELKDLAAKQLISKRNFKDLVWSATKTAGTESVTESLQEAWQYSAIAGTTSNVFNWEEMLSRSAEAFVIGGIASSPLGIHSANVENNTVNAVIWDHGQEAGTRSKQSQWTEAEIIKNGGKKLSNWEAAQEIKNTHVASAVDDTTGKIKPLSSLYNSQDDTVWNDFKNLIKNPTKFLVNWKTSILGNKIQGKGGKVNHNILRLAGLIDQTRVYSGTSANKQTQQLSSQFNSHVGSLADLAIKAGVTTVGELDALNTADPATLTPAQQEVVAERKAQLNSLMHDVVAQAKERGVDLGIDESVLLDDFLLKHTGIDQGTIDDEFVNLLTQLDSIQEGGAVTDSNPKLERSKAQQIANDIRNGSKDPLLMSTLEQLGVFSDPRFSKYHSPNSAANAVQMGDYFARKIVRNSMFGENNEVLSKLLHKAREAGEIDADEMADLAMGLDNFIKASDSKFKEIDSQIAKVIQENALLFSQLAYMDSNMFANMAEAAYGLIGLDSSQYKKYFADIAKAFAQGVKTDITNTAKSRLGLKKDTIKRTPWSNDAADGSGADLLGRLSGLGHTNSNEILIIEGTNTTGAHAKISKVLFKVNLVEAQTNAIKAARGAAAWNEMNKLLSIVAESRVRGSHSDGSRWAEDRLNYYGVDIDEMLTVRARVGELTENEINEMDFESPEFKTIRKNYVAGVTNFTDEFTARPEVGSSPKIFDDPRFRMFTQFKRFLSHFTANIIPQLWTMYLKRGRPGTGYNVFSSIMLSLILAGLAQNLKHEIKYGDSDVYLEDFDENFWESKFGRAAKYSGWLGTPELAMDAILKYNEKAARGDPGSALFETALAQSAAANTIYQIGKSSFNPKSDTRKLLAGKVPFAGDVKPFREWLAGGN